MSKFLLKAWYMAGWSEEVGKAPLSRRLVDLPIVLFRSPDGVLAALLDKCPHRFAPLSRGVVDEEGIRCPYHGLKFDPKGRCVSSALSAEPPKASVASYPVVERDSIIWFWPGDKDRADPALIPDFTFLEDMNLRTLRGLLPMKAGYEIGTDNLLDLSHIEFLHTGTFAGDGVIFAGQHCVRQDGNTVHSNWWMPNVAAPSGVRALFAPAARVDHWLDMRWDAPASMSLQIGATATGRPREEGRLSRQAHILTPETSTTTHYFWSAARPASVSEDELELVRTNLTRAFAEEDKPMIEAVQINMNGEDFWALRPVVLPTDAGGIRARRILAKLIRDESAGRSLPS